MGNRVPAPMAASMRGLVVRRFIRPFERFFQYEASSSVLLLAAAVIALGWANSPWGHAYEGLLHTHVSVGVAGFELDRDLHFWINDALMAVFFLLVGLEVKREFLMGRLSNPRAAMLPIVAAVGGMIVPALIYTSFNWGTPAIRGWGVPMATDIAFALGVLALAGPRVPSSLRIFLAALAIVDDLGAVLVIALFYTPSLNLLALVAAGGVLLALVALNVLGVRSPLPYLLVGVGLWLAVLQSGVHATIAGVLLALCIPARLPNEGREKLEKAKRTLERAPVEEVDKGDVVLALSEAERQAALLAVEKAAEREEAPLTRLEHALVPYVAYGIMPIFALANAGVSLAGDLVAILLSPITLGILVGLVVGKQVGIVVFPWLAVRMGIATLPPGAEWKHVYGVAWLAGIGFTVALFIAQLAFAPEQQQAAKIGIFAASFVAGVGGLLYLRGVGRPARAG